jgi:hypothetical protein
MSAVLGMVENVGAAAGTPSKYISVQNLFLLPVFGGRHFEFRVSTGVGPCRQFHI